MKKLALAFLLFVGVNGMTQGLEFGINVSPGLRIIVSQQTGTGLRSYQTGFGFSTGIALKYWVSEFTSFNTGLDYEFSAFDSFQNTQLVSSFRLKALHLPLMLNIHLRGSFYAMAGSGLAYNLAVRDLNAQGNDLTGNTNRLQPYLGLGVNSLMEKDFGNIELGALLRFQVLNIWKKNYLPFQGYSQHLAPLEFVFRYYF